MVVTPEYYIPPTTLGLVEYLGTESPPVHELEGERVFMMVDALQIATAFRNATGVEAIFDNSIRRFDMPWAPNKVDRKQLNNDQRAQFIESTGAYDLFARISGFDNWREYIKMVNRTTDRKDPEKKVLNRLNKFSELTDSPRSLIEMRTIPKGYDVFADIVEPNTELPEEDSSVAKLVATAAIEHTRVEAHGFLQQMLIEIMLSHHGQRGQRRIVMGESAAKSIIEFGERSNLASVNLSRTGAAIVHI